MTKMSEVKGNVKYQYLAGIFVNIISLSYGAFCGWPSASFLVLQSDESPLEDGPMSKQAAGWVGAVLCIGGACGTIFFGWCADRLGRRKSLMLIVIPALLGWLIIPFATTPFHLCISRFMGGLAGGGTFGVIPIYVTELADNNMRGILGTFMIFSCNIGVLFAFVLGYFLSYVTVAWIMAIPCFIFLLSFSFLPETPQHLLRQNKIDKAEKSFLYFRNVQVAMPELPENLKSELQKLKSNESLDPSIGGSVNTLKLEDFLDYTARKAFFIGMFLMSLNQFCGLFAMLNYTATIFEVAKSNLSPNLSAIVVGIIQIFGSYFSTLLVERMGRKLLLICSSIGTAMGLISLGTYIYLNNLGYDLSTCAWIPLASFSFTIFVACMGVLPLPFLILSEIMPPKIRNFGCMFCMLCLWFFAFTLLKLLPFLMDFMGLEGLVFMFGGYCLASAAVVLVFIPETKGRSIEEIMTLL